MSNLDVPSATLTGAPPYDEVLTLACRAPSVHNTQPWLWRETADGLELLADRSRQLLHSDPSGRDLTISCGAVLHHLRVAAAGLGWAARVRHLPEPDRPHRLATVTFVPAPISPEAGAMVHALASRQTDRRSFSDWPVPPEQLEALVRAGSRWGAHVLPVADDTTRQRLTDLQRRADAAQRRDTGYVDELEMWRRADRGSGLLPSDLREEVPDAGEAEGTGLLIVATSSDDTLSRLRAGEALSEVWLRATVKHLSVVPLSQGTEVERTREEIGQQVLGDRMCPQILLRVGWLPGAREPLARSPRRPLRDVFVRH